MKLLLLLLLLGCAGPRGSSAPAADGLASSTSTAAPQLAPTVSVTDGEIRVDGRPVVALGPGLAVPARALRGQLVVPLYDALVETREQLRALPSRPDAAEPGLLVELQADHPWPRVRDVLYTAGQAGYYRYQLAVAAPGGAMAVIHSQLPGSLAEPGLVVGVEAEGFTVAWPGAEPAPAPDVAALTAAAVRAKDARPDATLVVVVPAADASWQRVVQALDATRSSGDRALFADVVFTAPTPAPPLPSNERQQTLAGTPVALLGEPRITGGLDRATIEPVLQRHRNQLRYCYERELTREPSLAGEVVIAFEVAGDGTVSGSRVERSTLDHDGLTACLAGRFTRMRFPEPADGGVATVSQPLHLWPRE